jgi:hypothetical protein
MEALTPGFAAEFNSPPSLPILVRQKIKIK